MKAQEQIPRNALVWIIISLFTLVLPHIERVPLWVLLVYVAAALWRVMVYRGHWSFPRWPIKLGLIFAAFAGILFSFRSVIGLEPTVALLLTAFAFKLLELKERKHAYVLLFLGYFVILTEFLFRPGAEVFFYLVQFSYCYRVITVYRQNDTTGHNRPCERTTACLIHSCHTRVARNSVRV